MVRRFGAAAAALLVACAPLAARAQAISRLPAASTVNLGDLVPVTQGWMGVPGTGTTRSVTVQQLVGLIGSTAHSTGGLIDNTPIGQTTPAPGSFSSLVAAGQSLTAPQLPSAVYAAPAGVSRGAPSWRQLGAADLQGILGGDLVVSSGGALVLDPTGVPAGRCVAATVDARGRVDACGALSAADLPGTYLSATGDVSANPATALWGTAARSMTAHLGDELSLDDAGCPHDGVTDATSCVNTFLNRVVSHASAGVGQSVRMGPYQYAVSSGNLVIPRGITLECTGDTFGQAYNYGYASLPCSLVVNPAYSVKPGPSTTLRGVNVLRAGLSTPASVADNTSLVASFAGTGIVTTGKDVHLEHVMVLGFALGVSSTSGRFYADGLFMDDTSCVHVDGSQDFSRLRNIECWPFLTTNQAFSAPSYAIAGVADNGSGLIRVTLAAPANPAIVPNSRLTIGGVGGFAAADYAYPATVIDPTHVDLQGSSSGPVTTTGASYAGSFVFSGIANMAGIVGGMTFAAAGFPAGTAVTGVVPLDHAVILSNPANATAAGVSATFGNAAYVASTGTMNINTDFRTGYGVLVTNTEAVELDNNAVFAHATMFQFGAGTNGVFCTDCSYDDNDKNDAASTGFLISDDAATITLVNGYTSSLVNQLIFDSSNQATTDSVIGMQLRVNGGVPIQMILGAPQISNTGMNGGGSVYVSDAIPDWHLVDDVWDLFHTNIFYKNPAATAHGSIIGMNADSTPASPEGATASFGTNAGPPSAAYFGGYAMGSPDSGGQVELQNTSPGAALSTKRLRVTAAGRLQILNAAGTPMLDAGDGGAITVQPAPPASVSAAGTTQGTATPLAACLTRIVGGSGGVVLFAPSATAPCSEVIANRSGLTQTVYPPSGSSIETGATNAPLPLANGGTETFLPPPPNGSTWAVDTTAATATGYASASPVSGTMVPTAAGIRTLLLTPASALAALTLPLPPGPVSGDPFCVVSTLPISTLSMTSAAAVADPPLYLNAFQSECLRFDGTTWQRTSDLGIPTPANLLLLQNEVGQVSAHLTSANAAESGAQTAQSLAQTAAAQATSGAIAVQALLNDGCITYAAAGSYTVAIPSWANGPNDYYDVVVVGAYGAGGKGGTYTSGTAVSGGSGGGAPYSVRSSGMISLLLASGSTVPVTVGAGGTPDTGSGATNGGFSFFGSASSAVQVQAAGGGHGANGGTAAPLGGGSGGFIGSGNASSGGSGGGIDGTVLGGGLGDTPGRGSPGAGAPPGAAGLQAGFTNNGPTGGASGGGCNATGSCFSGGPAARPGSSISPSGPGAGVAGNIIGNAQLLDAEGGLIYAGGQGGGGLAAEPVPIAEAWSGGTATVTFASALPQSVGTTFLATLSGVSPSGYNGTWAMTVVTSTTATFAVPGNLAAASVVGSTAIILNGGPAAGGGAGPAGFEGFGGRGPDGVVRVCFHHSS